jgi:HEAT repeat protein
MNESFYVESNRISELIAHLDDKDGLKRKRARIELTEFGKASVPSLILALSNPHEHVRWEAANALRVINDPEAARPLVYLLSDEVADVRWAAAEALVPLKENAILPLMEALVEHYKSKTFRNVAHYVLRYLEKDHILSQPVEKVYHALGEMEPELTVPWAAEAAVNELKK